MENLWKDLALGRVITVVGEVSVACKETTQVGEEDVRRRVVEENGVAGDEEEVVEVRAEEGDSWLDLQ